MTVFSIECTTCKARLKVQSSDAIGQILACPRCQSMVEVTAPAEWIAAPLTGSAALVPQAEAAPAPVASSSAPTLPTTNKWLPATVAGVAIGGSILVGVLMGLRTEEVSPDSVALTPAPIAEPAAPIPAPVVVVNESPAVEPSVSVEASAPEVALESAAPEPEPAGVTPEVKPDPEPPHAPTPLPLSVAEDWRQSLQLPLQAIAYQDVPLERLLDMLGQLAGVDLTIDREAWADDGISPRTLVSISAENTTLDKLLEGVLAEHHLAILNEGGALRVTSAARGRPYATELDVMELGKATPDGVPALAGLLRKFAAPDSWDVSGGFGTLAVDGTKLRIVNHAQAIEECDDLLRRLSAARHEAVGDPATARLGLLRTAWSHAGSKWNTPVTLTLRETAASDVIAQLAQAAGADLRIDRLSLEASGLTPDGLVSLEAQNEPLSAVLVKFLTDQRWGGWPGRDGELILGSPQAAGRREWVEFYPVGDLLAAEGAASFMERLVAEVAPATWPTRGGRGAAYFDEASKTVVVRQSSDVHRQLEDWLAQMLATKTRPATR